MERKSVFIVTYNGQISTEGYESFEGAVKFIRSRFDADFFEAITPFHYSDGENNYEIHEIHVV
jgi:hypothetical protein